MEPPPQTPPVRPQTSLLYQRIGSFYGRVYAAPYEPLRTFNLQELRKGFFEPVFTAPSTTHYYDSLAEERAAALAPAAPAHRLPYAHPLAAFRALLLRDARIISSNWLPLAKFFVAFFALVVLCVVGPLRRWFGNHSVFIVIAVVLNHPAHSLGVQLEITVQLIVGIALGLGWGALALYVATCSRVIMEHPGGAYTAIQTPVLFLMCWVRAHYNRLYYTMLAMGISMLAMISIHQHFPNPHWSVAREVGLSYLFGVLLLFLAACVLPNTGHRPVVSCLLNTCAEICAALDLVLKPPLPLLLLEEAHTHAVLTERTVFLSEEFRECANQLTILRFPLADARELRNLLQSAVTLLRTATLTNQLFNGHEAEDFNGSSPRDHPLDHTLPSLLPKQALVQAVQDYFRKPLHWLVTDCRAFFAASQECISECGSMVLTSQATREEHLQRLQSLDKRVKEAILAVDQLYRQFARLPHFNPLLLADETAIDMLLLVRYVRGVAKTVLVICSRVEQLCRALHRWHFNLPSYPLHRALTRLPRQCLHDQGNSPVLSFYNTTRDVEEVFVRIYHMDTLHHQGLDGHDEDNTLPPSSDEKAPPDPSTMTPKRAINHTDFVRCEREGFTDKLFRIANGIYGRDLRYAFKATASITLLMVPGWIPSTHGWYYEYGCYWAPMILYVVMNPMVNGNLRKAVSRTVCCVLGVVWGFCAQAAALRSGGGAPYIMCVFAMVFSVPFLVRYVYLLHAKLGVIGLLSFAVAAFGIEPGPGHTKRQFVLLAVLMVGIWTSVGINWVLWPFFARHEIRKTLSCVLGHLNQLYQMVSERYLYRDSGDDPTELTTELLAIREVRMAQSLYAARQMLGVAEREHLGAILEFDPVAYRRVLDVCDRLYAAIVEVRLLGHSFRVWETYGIHHPLVLLLALRRDAVCSVIFVVFLVASCFGSHNKLPQYMPSALLARKRLFAALDVLEDKRAMAARVGEADDTDAQRQQELVQADELASARPAQQFSKRDFDLFHWKEIHAVAFAKAYTKIYEEVEMLKVYSKAILGEESL